MGGTDSDWDRFWRLYEKPILAAARARSLNDADCQDVLQETMIKMQSKVAMYDPDRRAIMVDRFNPKTKERERAPVPFTKFLFRVVKGCAIDAWRRNHRRHTHEVPIDRPSSEDTSRAWQEPADPGLGPGGDVEVEGQKALVRVTLDFLLEKGSFKPKTVQIVKALFFEEKSPEEVAKSFATSRGNVDQAKSTVLKKLTPMLRGLDQGFSLEQALTQANKPQEVNYE